MNRRRLLGTAMGLPLAMAVRKANAGLFRRRGGVTPGGGGGDQVTLATMTLVNTSGSTQAADFITPFFGHVFKKGDIPTGTYPSFVPAGGSASPYTMWSMSTWNDGSLRRAGFMFRCGVSIAGSGTLAVEVKNQGSAPGTSSRATSDLTARDLKVLLTGITNLSGEWISSLNTGITDATEIKVIGDGGAGKLWRIRAPFKQSGAAHGQMEGYWYAAALQDAAAGLYRIRFLPRIVQPWLDIDTPAKIKRGFSGTVQDGATVLQTLTPNVAQATSFTSTNGNTAFACPSHGLANGMVVRMTNPPAGFATDTDYYVHPITADLLSFHPRAVDAVGEFPTITPTSSVTGTITPHIELVHFASAWGCGADAKYTSIQGGGSAANEPTVRIQHDKAYWRSTKMMPPYDLTVTAPAAAAAVNYTPNGHGIMIADQNGTGERAEIGLQPAWVAQHFLLQDAVSEQSVRVNALSLSHASYGVRRQSTGTIPVINNGTYSGMGAANTTFRWRPGATSGFTEPSDDIHGCVITSVAHWPSCFYYAALMTGEPQYDDLLAENANFQPMMASTGTESDTRNPIIDGVTYYGVCYKDTAQIRTDAWSSRELSLCYALPDNHWDGPLRTYLTDMASDGFDAMNAYNGEQDAFWNDNGIYHFRVYDATGAPWQHTFLLMAVAMGYALSELPAALTFLNHLIKFPAAIKADIGLHHYNSYQSRMRQTNSGAGPLVSAMSQIHYVPSGSYSGGSIAATDLVTIAVSETRFTLSADDKILYIGSAPAGLEMSTSYFARDVTDPGISSNKTAKVSLTSGGAALDITEDTTLTLNPHIRISTFPAGSRFDYATITGTIPRARAAFRYAEVVGATMPGTIRADMDAMFDDLGISFTGSDPKNAMVAAY